MLSSYLQVSAVIIVAMVIRTKICNCVYVRAKEDEIERFAINISSSAPTLLTLHTTHYIIEICF